MFHPICMVNNNNIGRPEMEVPGQGSKDQDPVICNHHPLEWVRLNHDLVNPPKFREIKSYVIKS